jgi:hypothetical protein
VLQFDKEVTRSSFGLRRVLTIISSQVTFVWVRAQPQRSKDPELIGYAGATVVDDDMPIPCCELYLVRVLHGFSFLVRYQVRYFGIFLAMYIVVVVSF